MSKWYGSDLNCITVIPDIHGAIGLLDQILARILPLRFSDGGTDRLIFLGDYIDRHQDSHLVLDRLIELKKEYKDQVIFLKGNHEELLLRACNQEPDKNLTLPDMNANFRCWINNGGLDTIRGYLERAGITDLYPSEVERFRVESFIPKEHFKFLREELVDFYKLDNFLFVHGGCNPNFKIEDHEPEILHWDRSLYKYMRKVVILNETPDWDLTIIVGHSPNEHNQPFIHEKFMMLDSGSPKELLAVELRSMTAYKAFPNYERLVKFELKETTTEDIINWELNKYD